MTMPSIHATTAEHLGPEADDLDLEAYKELADQFLARYAVLQIPIYPR